MDWLKAIPGADKVMDWAGAAWQQDKYEGMQDHAQNFSASQADKSRQWSEQMRATQYTTAVADMKAAGLNPMLAYSQGGAGTPSSPSPSGTGGGAAGVPPSKMAQAFHSAAQAQLIDDQAQLVRAQTDREKATADEIRERTPTHSVSIDRMRQEITESVERIGEIQQRIRTGVSSAAHLDQQVRNLQETIPQIRAATTQLNALTKLNQAQAVERLTASGLNEAHAKEILQRVKQDLPALERRLMDLTRIAEEMQQPGRMADEAAKDSLVGQIGAYLKALVPLQGVMGALPLGRFGGGGASTPKYKPNRGDYAPGQGPNR